MANIKDESKKKTEPSNFFLTVRVDREYKKKFDTKAEKENIKSPDVIKYLADAWLKGDIMVDVKITVTQKKK